LRQKKPSSEAILIETFLFKHFLEQKTGQPFQGVTKQKVNIVFGFLMFDSPLYFR